MYFYKDSGGIISYAVVQALDKVVENKQHMDGVTEFKVDDNLKIYLPQVFSNTFILLSIKSVCCYSSNLLRKLRKAH